MDAMRCQVTPTCTRFHRSPRRDCGARAGPGEGHGGGAAEAEDAAGHWSATLDRPHRRAGERRVGVGGVGAGGGGNEGRAGGFTWGNNLVSPKTPQKPVVEEQHWLCLLGPA